MDLNAQQILEIAQSIDKKGYQDLRSYCEWVKRASEHVNDYTHRISRSVETLVEALEQVAKDGIVKSPVRLSRLIEAGSDNCIKLSTIDATHAKNIYRTAQRKLITLADKIDRVSGLSISPPTLSAPEP